MKSGLTRCVSEGGHPDSKGCASVHADFKMGQDGLLLTPRGELTIAPAAGEDSPRSLGEAACDGARRPKECPANEFGNGCYCWRPCRRWGARRFAIVGRRAIRRRRLTVPILHRPRAVCHAARRRRNAARRALSRRVLTSKAGPCLRLASVRTAASNQSSGGKGFVAVVKFVPRPQIVLAL